MALWASRMCSLRGIRRIRNVFLIIICFSFSITGHVQWTIHRPVQWTTHRLAQWTTYRPAQWTTYRHVQLTTDKHAQWTKHRPAQWTTHTDLHSEPWIINILNHTQTCTVNHTQRHVQWTEHRSAQRTRYNTHRHVQCISCRASCTVKTDMEWKRCNIHLIDWISLKCLSAAMF